MRAWLVEKDYGVLYDERDAGGLDMRLNAFVFLIASTVILGAFVGVMTSAFGVQLYWYTGIIEGGFLATTSLMGFWAYLMLNFMASVTLPRRVWRWTQWLVLAIVVYDMLWSRYHIDAARHPLHHATYSTFLVQGLWPLAVALLAAVWKRRLSGPGSYLPTVFYLYVFSVVDWLLVIWHHTGPIVNQTGMVMVACNVYMILIYGKLLSPLSEREEGLQRVAEARASEKAAREKTVRAKAAKKAASKKSKRNRSHEVVE